MSAKINLIKKHEEFGNQLITVDTGELETLGLSGDEDIQQKIAEKVAEGYYCFEFKGTTGSVYYVSPKPDGFVRDIKKHIEENGWDKGIKVFNAENDHLKWVSNVSEWFKGALADEEYVASINSLCDQALRTPPKNGDAPFDMEAEFKAAEQWLKDQQPTKAGKTGKRPVDINAYLTKSNTGYLTRSIRTYLKYCGTPGGWQKKRFYK
jgi:hypothetical protein